MQEIADPAVRARVFHLFETWNEVAGNESTMVIGMAAELMLGWCIAETAPDKREALKRGCFEAIADRADMFIRDAADRRS